MKAFLFIISFLFAACLYAQEKKSVKIKSGENIMNVLSREEVYLYPDFQVGKVHFKNGNSGSAKMNYSRLWDEFHFINSTQDTLALSDENNFDFIVINKDTFYYAEGYVQLVSSHIFLKVAEKQSWKMGDRKKIGAYNMPTSTASITAYTSVTADKRPYELVANEDIELRKEVRFYFGNNNNSFVIANKKLLMSMFPNQRKEIEIFLKEHKPDFEKKEDLLKILAFLGPK